MNDRAPQAVPAQLTESKGTNLGRELFTSNLWMSGLAMLKYIPRSFRAKQVDGMASCFRLTPKKRFKHSMNGLTIRHARRAERLHRLTDSVQVDEVADANPIQSNCSK
jgi:hypothetical protein